MGNDVGMCGDARLEYARQACVCRLRRLRYVRVCLGNDTHARCTPLYSVIHVSLDRPLRWGRMEDSLCPPDSRHGWVPVNRQRACKLCRYSCKYVKVIKVCGWGSNIPCIVIVAGLKLYFENQTTLKSIGTLRVSKRGTGLGRVVR